MINIIKNNKIKVLIFGIVMLLAFLFTITMPKAYYINDNNGNIVSENLLDMSKLNQNNVIARNAIQNYEINRETGQITTIANPGDPFLYFENIITLEKGNYRLILHSNTPLQQIGLTTNHTSNYTNFIYNSSNTYMDIEVQSKTTFGFGIELYEGTTIFNFEIKLKGNYTNIVNLTNLNWTIETDENDITTAYTYDLENIIETPATNNDNANIYTNKFDVESYNEVIQANSNNTIAVRTDGMIIVYYETITTLNRFISDNANVLIYYKNKNITEGYEPYGTWYGQDTIKYFNTITDNIQSLEYYTWGTGPAGPLDITTAYKYLSVEKMNFLGLLEANGYTQENTQNGRQNLEITFKEPINISNYTYNINFDTHDMTTIATETYIAFINDNGENYIYDFSTETATAIGLYTIDVPNNMLCTKIDIYWYNTEMYKCILSSMNLPEYQTAYQQGYKQGINNGYQNGYDSGIEKGKQKGITIGYNDGYAKGIIDGGNQRNSLYGMIIRSC